MATNMRNWLSEINILVYILIIIFNLSSWIDWDGLWAEMPLLVNRLPEGWDLPSYMIAIGNCSLVGVVIYVCLKHHYKDRMPDWPFVYFIIGVGSVCLLIVAFVWDRTTYINGADRSLPIMACMSAMSTVDKMSLVVFMNYMNLYKPQYLTAYFVGDGFCQMIPAIVGIGQGVSEDPICNNQTKTVYNETTGENYTVSEIVVSYPPLNFSVTGFFLFLFGMMCCSGIAFTILRYTPYCQRARLDFNEKEQSDKKNTTNNNKEYAGNKNASRTKAQPAVILTAYKAKTPPDITNDIVVISNGDLENDTKEITHAEDEKDIEDKKKCQMINAEFALWIIHMFLIYAMLFGVTPAVQPYACLPYGNRAYNLSVRLSLAMNPVVSFLALFVSTKSKGLISFIIFLGAVCVGYTLYLAIMSPLPPLKEHAGGEALVIIANMLIVAFLNYARSCIGYILQERGGQHGLMFGGAALAVGASIGALLFLLINLLLQPFEEEPPCPGM